MDRARPPFRPACVALLLAAAILLPSTGCFHSLLLTPIILIKGYNVDAAYDGLKHKRVVVVCRPPASIEYRHGGIDRDLAKRVGQLLAENVKHIDVVSPSEVEDFTDERDWEDLEELAEFVKADMVLEIDLETFSLLKGQTLYQGKADTVLTVYDMQDGNEEAWQSALGEIKFPENSGVPASEKPLPEFRRQYLTMLAERIARQFYAHEPHFNFANDGIAHR